MFDRARQSLFLLFIAIGALSFSSARASSPEVVPLELVDLEGEASCLHDLRGDVVVLNFWATWCAPCVEEMPRLVALQRELGAEGVQVVGASADAESEHDVVRVRARELRLNFPVWLGATTADMERFGLPGTLPGTVILDRSGVVRARHGGVVSTAWLEENVRALLDEVPDSAEAAHGTVDHDHADDEPVEAARVRRSKRDAATVPS